MAHFAMSAAPTTTPVLLPIPARHPTNLRNDRPSLPLDDQARSPGRVVRLLSRLTAAVLRAGEELLQFPVQVLDVCDWRGHFPDAEFFHRVVLVVRVFPVADKRMNRLDGSLTFHVAFPGVRDSGSYPVFRDFPTEGVT